jgi:hypothetical protein
MKVNYRGFEIDVAREKSMAGYSMIYYAVSHIDDLWEFTSGFMDSEDTVREIVKDMKNNIDDFYENPQDYLEEEDLKWELSRPEWYFKKGIIEEED